jgi:hypothetical protein
VTPTEAAGKMLTDTDYFFKYYPVKMFGGVAPWVPNAENIKGYHVCRAAGAADAQGNVGKVGHFGAVRPGKTFSCRTHNISSFQMRPNGQHLVTAQHSPMMNTCGVPMVNYNSDAYGGLNLHGNIAAMDYYVAGAGGNYLTTGGLSGCCFAWCETGGNLRCIHVLPHGDLPAGGRMTGPVLQTNLGAIGRFQGMPGQVLSTFGATDYGARRASVIGVRTVGSWKLFAQISSDSFNTITEVWQIHPGPRRQIR